MRPGIFSTPTTNEAEALKHISAVLSDHFNELLSEWSKIYSLIDMVDILSPEAFEALCRHELKRLIEALSRQEFDNYWDEVGKAAREMTAKGLPINSLCGLLHFFESTCNQMLIKLGVFDEVSLFALSGFMHNTLSLVVSTVSEAQNSHVAEQITVGRTIEATFRPKPPKRMPGLDLGVIFSPAPGLYEVGGDFYDLFSLADGTVVFTLGDASGRGVEAAGAAAMAKFMLRSFAAEHMRPGRVFEQANKTLPFFLAECDFVTAICGSYQPSSGELVLATAGHPRPVFARINSAPALIDKAGPALGVVSHAAFPEWEGEISPGDLLFMYTDGLMEARCQSEFFGEERIIKALTAGKHPHAQHYVDAVSQACLEFCDGRLHDDLTIVALRAAEI